MEKPGGVCIDLLEGDRKGAMVRGVYKTGKKTLEMGAEFGKGWQQNPDERMGKRFRDGSKQVFYDESEKLRNNFGKFRDNIDIRGRFRDKAKEDV